MERNKDNVTPRIPKGGTFRKRLWKSPECNTGIRNRGLRQKLQGRNGVEDLGSGQSRYLKKPNLTKVQVESMGNSDMNFTKTTRLEIAKRMVRSTAGLQKIRKCILWQGKPPPKRKKKQRIEEEPVT
jgi:hypothetical protein